jgi:Uma2 family endonuclease
MSVETTVYLDKSTFIEPDFIVRRKGKRSTEVRAPDLLLAIEVTDSSYRTDRKAKPLLYAAHGAPLLWVIDARDGFEPQTHVYSQPTPAGYASVVDRGLDEILELPFAPDVSFSLRSILYEYE